MMIQTLIEKLEININQVNTSTDVILDVKKDNLALKNHIIQLEQKIIQQEEVNLELKKEILAFKKHNNQKEEEVIFNLQKENAVLKNQPIEMNIQLNDLSNKKNPSLDVKNFNKCSSYQFDGDFMGILELKDGTISCFTKAGINLLKLNGDTFKLIKTFPLISKIWAFPKQLRNENIIYVNCSEEFTICDKDFNLIETLKESNEIWSLCNISEVSFAVGLANGSIKIYSKNSHTQKYERTKEYKPHSRTVYALLYLPKQNYLVSGSIDETIKVLSLPEGNLIQTLTGHSGEVTSIIFINDETFASGSFGEIKIWSIKENIQCIKTRNSEKKHYVYLRLLGNDFIVSRCLNEFKIWDVENYECVKTFEEEKPIKGMTVTGDNSIITGLDNKKVNLWKN
jgi:WD40 repeat protein